MNTTTRTATALGLSALAALGLAVGGAVAASAAPTGATVTAAATADEELADMLVFMREEERLARDIYAEIAELYDGARPFSMITNSEDNHYDAVGVLLDRYGIDDPSEGLAAGTYADDDLQVLYDDLMTEAETSLAAAYGVGITIEETDIADLEAAIAADYPADVDNVLGNLLDGSENHLAAFTAAADGTLGAQAGGNGPAADRGERGAGMMAGQGNGNGNANGNGNGRGAANGDRIQQSDGTCLLPS